jgi:hypothetical protein
VPVVLAADSCAVQALANAGIIRSLRCALMFRGLLSTRRARLKQTWSTPSATRSRLTTGARSGCGILASMFTFGTRRRRWLLGAIATALVVSLAALLLSPMLEHAVRARIESAAVRHGAVARIGVVP